MATSFFGESARRFGAAPEYRGGACIESHSTAHQRKLRLAAALVVLMAIVPNVLVIVTMMVAIEVVLARLGDNASARCHEHREEDAGLCD